MILFLRVVMAIAGLVNLIGALSCLIRWSANRLVTLPDSLWALTMLFAAIFCFYMAGRAKIKVVKR